MKQIDTYASLEAFGRVRLSRHFFMRDFLYSEISNFYGIPNMPGDPDIAIEAGKHLCEELLEPLNATFGRIAVRSAFRSEKVNEHGNLNKHNCASNESNYAGHIWDRRDAAGNMGATACIVIPWFMDRYAKGADWRSLAYWIHDHLPYSEMEFFDGKGMCSFNLTWSEAPKKNITSWMTPRVLLKDAHGPERYPEWYADFPELVPGPVTPGSIEWFAQAISQLPSDKPVTRGTLGYNNYTTQKDHWLGWLNPESGTGTYPRKSGPGRDACYVYNHIMEPLMLLWLIGAAGVREELVLAAGKAAEEAESLAGKAAAIRKIVPWREVLAALP